MKQKTYLDKLLENDKFKEKFNEEYQNLKKSEEEEKHNRNLKLIKDLEEDYRKAINIIKKAIVE